MIAKIKRTAYLKFREFFFDEPVEPRKQKPKRESWFRRTFYSEGDEYAYVAFIMFLCVMGVFGFLEINEIIQLVLQ